ncbi:unnamed protein product [Rhizophagus irregularis]|nr:unnamed protein product [Rhizophagus irregularis]
MSGNKLPGISSIGTDKVFSPNYMTHGISQILLREVTNISNIPHSPVALRNHEKTMQKLGTKSSSDTSGTKS